MEACVLLASSFLEVVQIIISEDLEVIFDSTLVPLVYPFLVSEKKIHGNIRTGLLENEF